MPWLPPAPPACEMKTAGFAALFQRSLEEPAIGFSCAGLLSNPEQRDRVLRQSYLAAMSQRDKETARTFFGMVQEKPWVGDVNFYDAAQLARALEEGPAAKLLLAAARRHPGLAIREIGSYWDLKGGMEAFEQAALLAPDEAVSLSRANSPTGEAVRDAMAGSQRTELHTLRGIAARDGLHDQARQRMAVLFRENASAQLVDNDAQYFRHLADLRLSRSGEEAKLYDRALENFSQMLFVEARNGIAALERMKPHDMPARASFLMLSYGRTEADDTTFERIFDDFLAPKLRGPALEALVAETKGIQLRQFLSTAITHHRFGKLLELSGSEAARMSLLERAVRGLDQADRPLDEAVAAAEVLDNTEGAARLKRLSEVLGEEYARIEKSGGRIAGIYGLLAARLAQRGAPSELGVRFQPYLRPPAEFETGPLFRDQNTCIQRHFFYDDDDGVESFSSFRQTFERDPAWKWERQDGWVRLMGRGSGGRRIVILANEPLDLTAPGNRGKQEEAARRQAALTRYLSEQSLVPTVVVHRGHAYHVEKTLRHLTESARLIFLGSCRGTTEIEAVMSSAASAQVIATKSVGTLEINDPLLKAINTALLRGEEKLDWETLWNEQRRKLGGNALFRDYIPPHRNSAAILLAAYHHYLSGALQ